MSTDGPLLAFAEGATYSQTSLFSDKILELFLGKSECCLVYFKNLYLFLCLSLGKFLSTSLNIKYLDL